MSANLGLFQLGKSKAKDEASLKEETFRRWREASLRPEKPPVATQIVGSENDSAPLFSQAVSKPATPATTEFVEEVRLIEANSKATKPNKSKSSIENTKAVNAKTNTPAEPATEKSKALPLDELLKKTSAEVNNAQPSSQTSIKPSEPKAEWPEDKRSFQSEKQVEPQHAAPKSATSRFAQFMAANFLGSTQKQQVNRQAGPLPEVKRELKPEPSPLNSSTPALKPAVENIIPPSNKVAVTKPAALTPEEELKNRFGGNIKSALGPGTIIEGKFSFDAPVRIEGTLIGEVKASSVLIVGPEAKVKASISVGSLIVLGSVEGKVDAKDLIEIKAGGSLIGDISSARLAMDDGAYYQGRSRPKMPAINQPTVNKPAEVTAVIEEVPQLEQQQDPALTELTQQVLVENLTTTEPASESAPAREEKAETKTDLLWQLT